ncbi:ribonuclease T2 [Actibacterium sp. 188UL27-1]|uniref:ribonuclease T2 family protein n=1 Tax=Actibacterium sp. 188UL27-1 TaxID=2786961 RepID=UPI00195E2DE7|nr:ribonuclease T2 [Actibacterium sp. 188UL27-1]MBM7067913.1 ribonuclease T2 [Actibacterium sp. 188UL27-1]
MRQIIVASLVLWAITAQAKADGELAGQFDYYVMALSWNATWCAVEGDGRGADQCNRGRGLGWTLHGLWPQFEKGWPSYCRTAARDPSRRQTAGMADIMGSGGLAWHQWKKHGRCSGLEASAYFDLSRKAYGSVTRPPVLRKLDKDISVPVSVIEEAWLEANSTLSADQITLTCRDGHIQEARICLTKDLKPRRCGRDTIRDCQSDGALLPAMR